MAGVWAGVHPLPSAWGSQGQGHPFQSIPLHPAGTQQAPSHRPELQLPHVLRSRGVGEGPPRLPGRPPLPVPQPQASEPSDADVSPGAIPRGSALAQITSVCQPGSCQPVPQASAGSPAHPGGPRGGVRGLPSTSPAGRRGSVHPVDSAPPPAALLSCSGEGQGTQHPRPHRAPW